MQNNNKEITLSNNKSEGRWTKEEHNKFLDALKLFGKDWKKIQLYIKTRSSSQIRSHAQKFFNKHDKENKQKIPLIRTLKNKEKVDDLLFIVNKNKIFESVDNNNLSTISYDYNKNQRSRKNSCISIFDDFRNFFKNCNQEFENEKYSSFINSSICLLMELKKTFDLEKQKNLNYIGKIFLKNLEKFINLLLITETNNDVIFNFNMLLDKIKENLNNIEIELSKKEKKISIFNLKDNELFENVSSTTTTDLFENKNVKKNSFEIFHN